jgi:hypothetical protein
MLVTLHHVYLFTPRLDKNGTIPYLYVIVYEWQSSFLIWAATQKMLQQQLDFV